MIISYATWYNVIRNRARPDNFITLTYSYYAKNNYIVSLSELDRHYLFVTGITVDVHHWRD